MRKGFYIPKNTILGAPYQARGEKTDVTTGQRIRALMDGIDPRTVQQWMGHNELSTTLRYVHVSPAHEQEAMERLSYKIEPEEEQKTG